MMYVFEGAKLVRLLDLLERFSLPRPLLEVGWEESKDERSSSTVEGRLIETAIGLLGAVVVVAAVVAVVVEEARSSLSSSESDERTKTLVWWRSATLRPWSAVLDILDARVCLLDTLAA